MMTMDRNATITVFGMPLDHVAMMFTPPTPATIEPWELMTIGKDSLAYLYAQVDDEVANGDDTNAQLLIDINNEMARRKRMACIIAELRTIYAKVADMRGSKEYPTVLAHLYRKYNV